MHRFLTCTAIVLCAFCSTTYSQMEEDIDSDGSFWDRVYVGGNLGLQFGTITNIELSPIIGYRLTQKTSAGFGVTYIYYKIKSNTYGDFETNIYGGRFFVRRNITNQFYAYGEYESLNLEFLNLNDGSIQRQWVPGLFLGGGFFQPIGRNAGFNISALYNVIYDQLRSPYNSPLVLRVGITAGF